VHDVVIMGTLDGIRVFGRVSLQTAIAVGAVGGSSISNLSRVSLAVHGHLVLPGDDKRYLSKGGWLRCFRELRLMSKTNSPRPVAVMPTNAVCGARCATALLDDRAAHHVRFGLLLQLPKACHRRGNSFAGVPWGLF